MCKYCSVHRIKMAASAQNLLADLGFPDDLLQVFRGNSSFIIIPIHYFNVRCFRMRDHSV